MGSHFRVHRREGGHLALNPTLEAVAAAGQPILWINPMLNLIGLATSPVTPWDSSPDRLLASKELGRFEAHPLDTFRLSAEHGFSSDRLRDLIGTPERLKREAALRRAEAAADAERKIANTEAYLVRMDQLAAERNIAWIASDERAKIIELAGGTWPAYLGLTTRAVNAVVMRLPIPAEQWQGRLWVKHMHARPDRTGIHSWKLYRDLAQMGVHERIAQIAVNSWLHQLVDLFVVERTERGRGDIRFVTRDNEDRRRRAERARAARKPPTAEAKAAWTRLVTEESNGNRAGVDERLRDG